MSELGVSTSNLITTASGNVVQAGTIAGGVHFHSAAQSRVVPRQLPALARGFVGRDDLLDELDEIAGEVEQSGTVALAILSGMAGVGKTALAVRWGHRVAADFPDGQLYVDLGGYGVDEPLSAAEVLGRFLRALGVADELVPAELAERSLTFRSLLNGRRVLVVLDNARSEQQVRPLLPGSSSCVAVVTSRGDLPGLVVDQGAALLRVDLPGHEQALLILRGQLGRRVETEPEAAADLVRRCSRLPLALRIVSGLARCRPALGLAGLAASLADERVRLDVLVTGDDPQTAVRSVFSSSYRQLPADEARLFRLLGLAPGQNIGVHAVAALADVPVPVADRLLAGLLRAQLISETDPGRTSMHDLLRVYAAELVDPAEDRPALIRLFDYYLHAAEQADRLLSPRRFRIPLDGVAREAPDLGTYDQALAWLETERGNLAGLCQLDRPELDSRRWQLAYTLRGYFFLAKDWDNWIPVHQAALAAADRLGDPLAQAHTHNNLGLALLEQGDAAAAEPHYLRAQELFEQLGELRGAGNAMGNLAWILHDRGDHRGALDIATRALENYRNCGARTNAGITLRGIAVFEAALGDTEAAIAHLDEAMRIFTERGAGLDMAMALNCLGEVHCQAGDLRAGAEAHRRALALSREQGSRFEEARAHVGLGAAAAGTGEPEHAAQEWEQALELFTGLGAVEADQVRQNLADLDR